MTDIGRQIIEMDKEEWYIIMEISILEIGLMIKRMVMEYILKLMVINMKVNGLMI